MDAIIQRAVQSYKAHLLKKLQDDYGYYQMQNYDMKIRTMRNDNAEAHMNYIQELIELVVEHQIPDDQGKKWKKKHDELGREWEEYTQHWQETIEELERENLEKDQKIRELENYKWMYEQLSK